MRSNAFWAICGATCALASAPVLSADSFVELMRSCATQADDSARLQCYDRGMAQLKEGDKAAGSRPRSDIGSPAAAATLQASPARQAEATAEATPRESNAADQFGLTAGQILQKGSGGNSPAALRRLTAHVAGVSPRAGAHLAVRLDNGQMWEQTEDGPDLKIRAGDAVTIDRGVLGAYWLSARSGHVAIKVRRTE